MMTPLLLSNKQSCNVTKNKFRVLLIVLQIDWPSRGSFVEPLTEPVP